MPRLLAPDPPLPPLITIAAAHAAGLTVDQVRYRVESGRWLRLGPGLFRAIDNLPTGLDEHAQARLDHVHRTIAAARRNPCATVGFGSAALLRGLPLFSGVPKAVSLLVPSTHWTGRRGGVAFRASDLRDDEVTGMGIRVTSVARTWIDIARTEALADALAVGDAALRAGDVGIDELRDAVRVLSYVRGCRRAVLALQHVDGARESVLESGSWAYFVEREVPFPVMQAEIRDRRGRLIGRVDFLWEAARVIGECDGRMKYLSTGDLYAEKRREDALRERGYRVVRWGWSDLRSPALAVRLRSLV